MLFNSYGFIFLFLPITFAGFFLIGRRSQKLAALWLALASLFFYGWWDASFVALLLSSILFNYAAGCSIARALARRASRMAGWLLAGAITADLAVLAYFKYANFFLRTADHLGAHWGFVDIVLPLGISFFTFTQIAFLVDVRRGLAREYDFIHYLLFVTYFPHLIAGPVLHHKQMMPQFDHAETYRLRVENINVGLTIFILGLFKKVVLADQLALYANPVFDMTAGGGSPKLVEAWAGALAYALQLYFDFSGYSDMAIGLARLFNVKLPLNFNSPYKAPNVIEFWRRWHMTLSAFLRDYLYFPLGGNRKGRFRRYLNLMITMVLGGLWHGAGWTFVFWGALHGSALCINHAWHRMGGRFGRLGTLFKGRIGAGASVLLTFCFVVVAWVPFRAADFATATRMVSGMAGFNGISLTNGIAQYLGRPAEGLFSLSHIPPVPFLFWCSAGLLIVWGMPNTQEWMVRAKPAWDIVEGRPRLMWKPAPSIAVALGVMLTMSLVELTRASRFLYFQF